MLWPEPLACVKESYDEVLVVFAGVDQHHDVAVPRFDERDVRVAFFAQQVLPADAFDVGVPVRRRVRRKQLELVLRALRFEQPHARLSRDHHVFDVLQRPEGGLFLETEALELVHVDLLRVQYQVVVRRQHSRLARQRVSERVAADHARRQVAGPVDHQRDGRFFGNQVPDVASKRFCCVHRVVVQNAGKGEGLLVSLEGDPVSVVGGGLDLSEEAGVRGGVEPVARLGAGEGEDLGDGDTSFEDDDVEADIFVVHEVGGEDVAGDERGVDAAGEVSGDDGLLDVAAFLGDASVPRL